MSGQDAPFCPLVGQRERVETCAIACGCFSTRDGLQPQVSSLSKNLHRSLTYLCYATAAPKGTHTWRHARRARRRVVRARLRRLVQSACPWWAGSCDTATGKERGMMIQLQRLVGLVVVWGWLSGTGMVHADAVTDWHAITVQAL